MAETDPNPTDAAARSPDLEDDGDDAAWEALAEDRRRQKQERAGSPWLDAPEVVPTEPAREVLEVDTPEGVEAQTLQPEGTAAAPDPKAPPTPRRRVFVIDAKEYPDPDPELPITGARSVQAMYRDYFPGQLDNADVVQKTRDDGTLEVTFKRRIGTKGARRARAGASAVAITVPRVVGVLAGLPADRPLVWDLIEQAVAPSGALRLEYVPPAAQLNLAEAQQAARARQIEQTVGELGRLRPTG
jgi:hypothetical protein